MLCGPRTSEDGSYRRTGAISQWGQRFLDLADHPKLLPYLLDLVGSRVRLDHDYCIFMQKDASRNRLHGRSQNPRVRPLVPLQRRHYEKRFDCSNLRTH